MAEGDAITGAWQIELRGVLLDAQGGCDDGLIVTEWLSGFGVPSGRVNIHERPMRHGMFPGPQYMNGRQMVVGVMAKANSWANLRSNMMELANAFAPVEDTDPDYTVPLVFTMDDPTFKYRVVGMPTRAEWGYANAVLYQDDPFNRFADGALCEFIATDPLIYDNTEQSVTATLSGSDTGEEGEGEFILNESDVVLTDELGDPLLTEEGSTSDTSGLSLPHSFPHDFGSTGGGGSGGGSGSGGATAYNNGNMITYPTIIVRAGSTGASAITLQNSTTAQSWSITLLLSPGDSLVVNMDADTALLNGTADRSPFVNRPPSEWFGLHPGPNLITLVATGDGTTAEVTWRDAYLL